MLEQYTCTRCHTHPSEEKEVFNGCAICGNKMFRLEEKIDHKQALEIVNAKIEAKVAFDGVSSIEIADTGVYHVNIDKLFKDSKDKPVTIAEREGIYHIKL